MFEPGGPTFWELAEQALSSTERGYDLLAPKFDRTPFRTPGQVLASLEAHLRRGPALADALDLGCGTGAVLEVLQPLCRGRLVGLDLSRGMLEVARAALARAPGPARLELHQGDMLRCRYDREFDLVTCFGALGHVLPEDKPALVDNVFRSLRPGGRFAFATASGPDPLAPRTWGLACFDLLMRLRNRLLQPPFVMYYLNFFLPEARRMLTQRGFRVDVLACRPGLRLVLAQRPVN